MLLHIGIDDTDSYLGGCTTYVGYRITKRLLTRGIKVLDYPRLVRLNPNVPWKTRGNGAVGISIETELIDDIKGILDDEVGAALEKYGSFPTCVVITEQQRPTFEHFSSQAISRIIDAGEIVEGLEAKLVYAWTSRKQGLIGALAAASNLLDYGDHTFEVLAYRRQEYIGKPRIIDPASVKSMDRYARFTFNNIDGERILISPHGRDPVLFGIRGEDPDKLFEALTMVRSEPFEGVMVFKTNQATDTHYVSRKLSEVRLGDSVKLDLNVLEPPTIGLGGHVFVTLTDGVYKIKAAFYWETGELRKAASLLIPGDSVTVFGGVKVSINPTINVEKLLVNVLKQVYIHQNPVCPKCLTTSESAGRNKGYRCRRCKTLISGEKVTRVGNRPLVPGLYLPPIRYFRHLMKPLSRYGKEKHGYHFTTNTYKQII
ncbi:MAG: tRNA(Ile)(2)-agmatinylcytidine synthase [Thermoprotei archaeon]